MLVSIVDVGALAAFTLLHASVVGYFVVRRKDRARRAHWIVPGLGGLVTIWVIAESGSLAKVVGLAWLVLGLLALAARRR